MRPRDGAHADSVVALMTFAARAAGLSRRLTAEAARLRLLDLEAKARHVEAMAGEVAGWAALDASAMVVRVRGMLPRAPPSGVRLAVTYNDSPAANTRAGCNGM